MPKTERSSKDSSRDTGTVVVTEPWTWFFLPAELNPQDTDPSTDGSSARSYDDTDVDWAAVVRAATDVVKRAQTVTACDLAAGRLVQTAEVPCPDSLTEGESAIVRAWVGDPRESGTGVMVVWDEQAESFRIIDGRHRLWGARRAAFHRLPAALGRLAVLKRNRELVVPVRDETTFYGLDSSAYPDEDWAKFWVDGLDERINWWEAAGPLSAGRTRGGKAAWDANYEFRNGLRHMRDLWPNVGRADTP